VFEPSSCNSPCLYLFPPLIVQVFGFSFPILDDDGMPGCALCKLRVWLRCVYIQSAPLCNHTGPVNRQVARRVKWSTIGQVLRFVYRNLLSLFTHLLLAQFSFIPSNSPASTTFSTLVLCGQNNFRIFLTPRAITGRYFPALRPDERNCRSLFSFYKGPAQCQESGAAELSVSDWWALTKKFRLHQWKLDPTRTPPGPHTAKK